MGNSTTSLYAGRAFARRNRILAKIQTKNISLSHLLTRFTQTLKAMNRISPVLVYARVSSANQRDDGLSLDAQVATIREALQSLGRSVKGCVTETGSVFRDACPAMLATILTMRNGAVAFYAVDRLSRNYAEGLARLTTLLDNGNEVFFVREQLHMTHATGVHRRVAELLRSAEAESANISARARLATQYRRENKIHVGAPPYGFSTAQHPTIPTAKTLVQNPSEQKVIAATRIFNRGASVQRINEHLAQLHHDLELKGDFDPLVFEVEFSGHDLGDFVRTLPPRSYEGRRLAKYVDTYCLDDEISEICELTHLESNHAADGIAEILNGMGIWYRQGYHVREFSAGIVSRLVRGADSEFEIVDEPAGLNETDTKTDECDTFFTGFREDAVEAGVRSFAARAGTVSDVVRTKDGWRVRYKYASHAATAVHLLNTTFRGRRIVVTRFHDADVEMVSSGMDNLRVTDTQRLLEQLQQLVQRQQQRLNELEPARRT